MVVSVHRYDEFETKGLFWLSGLISQIKHSCTCIHLQNFQNVKMTETGYSEMCTFQTLRQDFSYNIA